MTSKYILALTVLSASVSLAEVVWTEGFEDGDISDWTITGTANWALYDNEFQAHTGDFSLEYNWHSPWPHDTRAVTPSFTLPVSGKVDFTWWWSGSYNYFVQVDNGDAFTEVRDINGGDWIVLWSENDAGIYTGFEWYEQTETLDASWSGKTVQFAFHIVASDAHYWYIDDLELSFTTTALQNTTWGRIKASI
ncbi:MAG: hypothetical protein K8S15_14185 [Candidatus Aegiribacteria sp.]|nr:hypothetical protein [Candidatus Aegiribacteria sp.]